MRKPLSLLGAFVVLLPLIVTVEAQSIGQDSATLTWQNDLTCTDSSVLLLSDTRVYREVNGSQVFNFLTDVPAGTMSHIDDNLFNGNYCYHVTQRGQCGIATVASESQPSNDACKVINIPGNEVRPLSITLTVQ